MGYENHYKARLLPKNASREERASVHAADILIQILENVVDEILNTNSKANIKVEGSEINNIKLIAQGLRNEDIEEIRFRTGLSPELFFEAEKTA
jgi:hypothetical protein